MVRDEILEVFSEFTRDESRSVLISSHIVSDLEKLCDYIAFLHKGRLLFFEEKDALRESCGLVVCGRAQGEALPGEPCSAARRGPTACAAWCGAPWCPGMWRWSLWGSRS